MTHRSSHHSSHHSSLITSLTLHPQRTVITVLHAAHVRTAERRLLRARLQLHTIPLILLARVVSTQHRTTLRTGDHCPALIKARGARAVCALHLAIQTLRMDPTIAAQHHTRAVVAQERAVRRTQEGGVRVFSGGDESHGTRIVVILALAILLECFIVLVIAGLVVVLPQWTVQRTRIAAVEIDRICALAWRHFPLFLTPPTRTHNTLFQLARHALLEARRLAKQQFPLPLIALRVANRPVTAPNHHRKGHDAVRTQHFSVHTATVTTHHPALLALHNRT